MAPAFDPRVSVVVITQNRLGDLLVALGHLTALPEHPRVILVDNASSDGTPAAVRERHPEVEVIALAVNEGGAARNKGVERASTPYVAFADDDSWWAPGSLVRAAELLDALPRLAVVNAHILVGPQERDDAICTVMAESPLPRAPGQPGHPLLSFVACAVVVRRDAFLAAGGFHPRFGVGGEEEVVGHRLAADGWLQSYVPELVIHHHPSSSRDPHRRRALGIRNTLWTAWLCRPAPAATWRTVAQVRRLPRDRVTLRGLGWALAGLPWVLGERRIDLGVERQRKLLDAEQLDSKARRYVS